MTVNASRTWVWNRNDDDAVARNVVTVKSGSDHIFACDLSSLLNDEQTLSGTPVVEDSLDELSWTGEALDAERKRVTVRCDTDGADAKTYTLTLTVDTTDSDTFVLTAYLVVT